MNKTISISVALSIIMAFGLIGCATAQASPVPTIRPDGVSVVRLGTISGQACAEFAMSDAVVIDNDRGVLANGNPVSREGLKSLCKTGAKIDVSLFASPVKNTGHSLIFTLVPKDMCRESLLKLKFRGTHVNGKTATTEADLALCDHKEGVTLELEQ